MIGNIQSEVKKTEKKKKYERGNEQKNKRTKEQKIKGINEKLFNTH
jgi:hypothetical protein